MLPKLDEKDMKILEVLRDDASLSTQQISKKTRIPITTVHHRMKQLRKEGTIKKTTIVVNHEHLGRPVSVFIMLQADYGYLKQVGMDQHDLARKISLNPYVEHVALVTGDFDILIKARVGSIKDLDGLLIEKFRNMDGVGTTRTMVVLNEFEK